MTDTKHSTSSSNEVVIKQFILDVFFTVKAKIVKLKKPVRMI